MRTLFACLAMLGIAAATRADDAAKVATDITWSCLEGRPGKVGLWVHGKYVGQFDPHSAAFDFPSGKQTNLRDLVNENNPAPKEPTPAPRVANSGGVTSRTENFLVTAPTKADADEFAALAEKLRKEIALRWLGKEMPRWPDPCPLTVELMGDDNHNGGGATTFAAREGHDMRLVGMEIKGGRGYLKSSVLPHEVMHTVMGHYLKRPSPRWCDEGAATTEESAETQARYERRCVEELNAGEAIKLTALFRMREYPRGPAMLTVYNQGHSVTTFLLSKKDRATFLEFVGEANAGGDWDAAVAKHYGFKSVDELQDAWIAWMRERHGKRPPPTPPATAKVMGSDDCGCSTVPGACPASCDCGCQAAKASTADLRREGLMVAGGLVVGVCSCLMVARLRRPRLA